MGEHTGESLYREYADYQFTHNNCSVDEWGDLSPEDQAAWDYVAYVANKPVGAP